MEPLTFYSNLLNRTRDGFIPAKNLVAPKTNMKIDGAPIATVGERVASYVRYLRSPSLIDALNDDIGRKLNTREHAAALCEYYRGNPNLKSLTLSKEVPRLDYEFALNGGRKLREPEEIRTFFDGRECDEAENLILRASNQTLMADLLVALVAEEGGVVKRQCLATAVATRCRFFVNLETRFRHERKFVKGVCDFVVSIPGGKDGRSRLRLASVRAVAFFSPGGAPAAGAEPLLKYHIQGIKPFLDPDRDSRVIQTASAWLATHIHHEEQDTHHAPPAALCIPKQQPSSFDLGFNITFRKPKLDFASKMRSVMDTVSFIDQQSEAAAVTVHGAAPGARQDAALGTSVTGATMPEALNVPCASNSALMMEQILLEQQIVLSQAKANVCCGVEESRNDRETICS